jgi:peptide deformylase
VTRSEWVKIKAQNQQGEWFELETDGLLAICIQHELDHLLGKVFVQYMSNLKQNMLKKKIKKHKMGEAIDD